MKVFGQGTGVAFPAPAVIAADVCRFYGVREIGRTSAVRERYYAISAERRLKHPGSAGHHQRGAGRAVRRAELKCAGTAAGPGTPASCARDCRRPAGPASGRCRRGRAECRRVDTRCRRSAPARAGRAGRSSRPTRITPPSAPAPLFTCSQMSADRVRLPIHSERQPASRRHTSASDNASVCSSPSAAASKHRFASSGSAIVSASRRQRAPQQRRGDMLLRNRQLAPDQRSPISWRSSPTCAATSPHVARRARSANSSASTACTFGEPTNARHPFAPPVGLVLLRSLLAKRSTSAIRKRRCPPAVFTQRSKPESDHRLMAVAPTPKSLRCRCRGQQLFLWIRHGDDLVEFDG